jgi:hypothetical protein
MALARQARRCALGKLDCCCGGRYCGDHNDANDVQIALPKACLTLLAGKHALWALPCIALAQANFTALGAGIGAFIGALLYLWGVTWFGLKFGVLKDGKPAPLLMPSAYVVFFALWAALVYASFSRWF